MERDGGRHRGKRTGLRRLPEFDDVLREQLEPVFDSAIAHEGMMELRPMHQSDRAG